ncbi:unnamed protein product [Staurois parvus]|uniref:Uncharacterized protein n=1 Tax=Staurois parvus TaxID=386267 RepID=A0ABN9AYF9_9NEOB|nr:unnamed protein product [Staurois parvus]
MHTHDEDWRQLTLIALLILVPDCGSAPDPWLFLQILYRAARLLMTLANP